VRPSAILVINHQPASTEAQADSSRVECQNATRCSIACAEILGQSVVERTIVRLRRAGIGSISVIGGSDVYGLPPIKNVDIVYTENPFGRWSVAQQKMTDLKGQGVDTVVVVGLGAYTEVDVAEALEFHHTKGAPLTQLEDSDGVSLDFWLVDAEWFRTAAVGCTLPFRYGEFPGLPVTMRTTAYVNRLTGAQDLRQLVVDALLRRCEMQPRGTEVKPGIWLDDGARVHKSSRLVAPVYVGRSARVAPSAVVTRFSNIERESVVGAATVVDESSVLANTVLGRGLELSNAVVHGTTLVNLQRNISVQIEDPNLIRDSAPLDRRVRAAEGSWKHGEGEVFNELGYLNLLSRAAGRFSEVFFKG
jgi:NDP-sugar pyrophosphorylase family protein